MGYGDQVIATGLARGAKDRGKRIAFGDGRRIIWDNRSLEVFENNPNIAPPGSEHSPDIEWVAFHKGHRIYNKQVGRRWIWNMDFRAVPGEVFFHKKDQNFLNGIPRDFILVDPNVQQWKPSAANKDWPLERYQAVVDELRKEGHRVAQMSYGERRLKNVMQLRVTLFRQSLAVLSRAKLAIVPEGGLHHGAAAVGVPAVVIFGGFVPPQVLGYEGHTNLTGGAAEACGNLFRCEHCRAALQAISVDEVVDAARQHLRKAA